MYRSDLPQFIRISCYCLSFLLLSVMAGCNQSLQLKVDSEVPTPLVNKIPMAMGVYYADSFKNYAYHENSAERKNWDIESGSSQVALFDQVLPSMFKEVEHVNSLPVGGDTDVQAVLVPTIQEMQFSLPQETHLDMYEVWIKYMIRMQDISGNVIAEWPLTAYGKSSTKLFKNREQGLNDAMQLALRDAGAKMAIGFPSWPRMSVPARPSRKKPVNCSI